MTKSCNSAPLSRLDAREALLKAAEELFSTRSYSAVSTRHLANRAAVNLGAIQYHFGSKANLFTAVIHRLLSHHWQNKPFASFWNLKPRTRLEAARALALFVFILLEYLCSENGPRACRIMFREILGETSSNHELFEELVNTVVGEFAQPLSQRLQELLNILRPRASNSELRFAARSIVGMCFFYFTNRPFIERMDSVNIAESLIFQSTAQGIIRFALRGFGCSEALVRAAIRKAASSIGKRATSHPTKRKARA